MAAAKQETKLQENSSVGKKAGYFTPAFDILYEISIHYLNSLYRRILSSRNERKYYKFLIEKATSYEQWAAAGYMLDRVEGNDIWKNENVSSDYDYKLLLDRMDILRTIRKNADVPAMIFNLRTSLSRNLAGMGDSRLYEKSHVGTKLLIEDYIDEVTKQLNFIADVEINGMTILDKLHFFRDVQTSFGRTALLFSGGGTFGLSHVGTIKVLAEQKLLPKIITGSSSGSIVASILCCQAEQDLWCIADTSNIDTVKCELNQDFLSSKKEADNPFIILSRLLKHGVMYDVEFFNKCMIENIGNVTFLEAYNRTRRILNITVSSSTSFEMPRVLNYLTAPNVLIRSAVVASCALPGLYKSAPLMAKDSKKNIVPWNPSGHKWVDGSIEGDIPMQRVKELFGVNHFLVAQVNPHIIPFLNASGQKSTYVGRAIKNFGTYVQDELKHRISQLIELGVQNYFLIKAHALVSQTFVGDITIVPNLPWKYYTNIVARVTDTFVKDIGKLGEKGTWQKIAILRNHMLIEQCISQIIIKLRRQLISEPSQVDELLKASKKRRSQDEDLIPPRPLELLLKQNSDPDLSVIDFNNKADFLELPLRGPIQLLNRRGSKSVKSNRSAGDIRSFLKDIPEMKPSPLSKKIHSLQISPEPIFHLDLTFEDSDDD